MSVYVHKAYISKNKCEGDHKYFNHEGYMKEKEQEKQQVIQKQVDQNEELHKTIAKQQNLINQLELQNSQYRIREENHLKEIKNLLLRIKYLEEEKIVAPSIPEQKILLDAEAQYHEVQYMDQNQQTENSYMDQECQVNESKEPEVIKEPQKELQKEPQFINKTVRIQAIYYKP